MPLPRCACESARNTLAIATASPDAVESGYHVVRHWPVVPEDLVLGAVAGVGVDANDNVLVFCRAGRLWQDPFDSRPIARPTVLLFDGRGGGLGDARGGN